MQRSSLLNVALSALTLCAAAAVGLAYQGRVLAARTPPAVPPPSQIAGWRTVAAVGERMGEAENGVVITVFSDFQCPYCARMAVDLRSVRERFSGRVRVVFRHLPLTNIHPFALDAAFAAVCAGQQGAFERFHDYLFEHQGQIGTVTWDSLAVAAGMRDGRRLAACLTDPAVRDIVARDQAAASELGLRSTPSFLVNGTRYVGDYGRDSLFAFVERALLK